MAIISKQRLTEYYQAKQRRDGASKVAALLRESKNFKGLSIETVVFLSHKHNEKEKLNEIVVLLRDHGAYVYVDWLDQSMPANTSPKTARKLKERIQESNKFILLASEGAINSKWCNWELGLGDGYKRLSNIALFPLRDTGKEYSGSEYLEIYPHIEEDGGIFFVKDTNGNRSRLREWLR